MSQTQTARPFTGRHMLLIMLGFFAVVLTANMTMVYFASHSWSGLVVKNSYVASQEFNETTDKMMANAAVDVLPALAYEAGILRVKLQTKAGQAVNGERDGARFRHHVQYLDGVAIAHRTIRQFDGDGVAVVLDVHFQAVACEQEIEHADTNQGPHADIDEGAGCLLYTSRCV